MPDACSTHKQINQNKDQRATAMLRAAVFRQLKRLSHHTNASPPFASVACTPSFPISCAVDSTTSATPTLSPRRFFATENHQHQRKQNQKQNKSNPSRQAHGAATTTRGSDDTGIMIDGISLKNLATMSKSKLVEMYGRATFSNVLKTLPQQLETMLTVDNVANSTVAVLKQIFAAADKCNAPHLMRKALDAVEKMQKRQQKQQPARFELTMYNALYNSLQRQHDHDGLLQVYDDFQLRLEYMEAPLPEVVYRCGIVGKFGSGDLAGVEEIVREMREYKVQMTNEVWSQLMLGFAKAEQHERALKIFHFMMNGDITKLHEADMNRVILALGCVGKPQLAFEFYHECQVPLSATAFNALLSVCVHNDALKEALAVLQNRTRFGLVLDAVGYTRVLEALEHFERNDEIVHVLHEMKTQDVRFSPKVEEIIARNQEHLAGTVFTLNGSTGANGETVAPVSTDEMHALVENLRSALASDDLEAATCAADSLVSVAPRVASSNAASKRLAWLGATTVRPLEATELVVETYVRAGHHHKIDGLVRGFQLIAHNSATNSHANNDDDQQKQTSVANALARVFQFAVDDERADLDTAYGILCTSLQYNTATQKLAIARAFSPFVEQAIDVLSQQRDLPSALQFLDTLLTGCGDRETDGALVMVDCVLEMVVRDGNPTENILAVLDTAERHGVPVTTQLYPGIVTRMLKTNHAVLKQADSVARYSAHDVQRLWENCRHRGLAISKALIASSSSLLFKGDVAQRVLLWDAFQDATLGGNDGADSSFTFRASVFQDLMDVAVKDHKSAETTALYDLAVAALTQAKSGVPAELLKSVIDKLVSENKVDEAFERLQSPAVKPPNSAIAVTLRAIVERDGSDPRALQLLQQMHVLHKRGLGLPMALSLMQTASSQQQHGGVAPAGLAWALVQSFEFRKLTGDATDVKTWKSLVGNLRGLENARQLYNMATQSCGTSDNPVASSLQKRTREVDDIEIQWKAAIGEKCVNV